MIWSYVTSFVVYQSLYLSVYISGRYAFYIILELSHLCLISLGPGFPDFPVLGGGKEKGEGSGGAGSWKNSRGLPKFKWELKGIFPRGYEFRGILKF